MTSSVLMRLCNIALKPGISAATQLTTTRRICRIVSERLDSITAERRAFRREASKLKPFLPFAKQAIADIERQALTHREVECAGGRAILSGFGKTFIFDRERLAEALGFERMCDLLNVNPVHRHQAAEDGDTSLQGIAYLSQLEDSSSGYGDDWGAGGPIYRACHAAMIQFIRECPEDQLPDLFEPGAPLAPKSTPQLTLH
ncbi:hypothetical protein N032_05485 [Pseudomonas syringae pv. pisi str. PP1]|uniref:hypothetical protein n=1 Tax=Pseudomonas syringae TaxID=317 RepID=UPI0004644D1F|nr:hypothetical protein [Pseudomonas syringae]AZG85152.1 hypothetical protein N032_05485 [Pseudomonas syringae pv. pisi str. PP1]RMM26843.1 hypothetical protein ALQ81_04174 [Pseudomonas syringae pv. pisi]UZS63574.1 hypothetical protein OQB64_05195 [Pseudomonas syringae]